MSEELPVPDKTARVWKAAGQSAVQHSIACQLCAWMQVETVPYDFRFPGVNQARNCYTRYNEYYK